MKLAQANLKQNPGARETCGNSKASRRLPEDDGSLKAPFLLITLDLYDSQCVQNAVGFKWKLGFELVKKVWE